MFTMRVRVMLAFGCLVAGVLALSAGTAHAAYPGQAANPLAACQKWAKSHTFVLITKAARARGAGLNVAGQQVTVHCGGPDDMQYLPTGKRFAGRLRPAATINVLVFGRDGVEFPRLPQSRFPRWVATDHNSGIYTVTGPFRAIRALHEQYHP